MSRMRECRLCHRVGYGGFVVAGGEEWECANDRACQRRKATREDVAAQDLGVRAVRAGLERAPEAEASRTGRHAPGLPGAAEERVLARPHAPGPTVVVRPGPAVDRNTDGVSPRDVIECPVIRASLPCRTCGHRSCGWCPECHPGLPEWSG